MKKLPQDVREALQEVLNLLDVYIAREDWSRQQHFARYGLFDGKMKPSEKWKGPFLSREEFQRIEDRSDAKKQIFYGIKGDIHHAFKMRGFSPTEQRDCEGQMYFDFFDKRDLYPKIEPF